MYSHLQGGKVDISTIQHVSSNSLLTLIEKCPGPKAFVLDEAVVNTLCYIIELSVLKEHSVVKLFPLNPSPLPETNVAHVIFITRPKLSLMDFVAHKVHADSKIRGAIKKQYHLFFVPRKSYLCIERLKHSGVYGSMTSVEELPWQVYPIESDLISMEMPEAFKECTIDNDPTCLYQIAQVIILLQKLYGPVPRVWGKGVLAKQAWDLVLRLQKENSSSDPTRMNQTASIDQIILIDRSIDMITPLATQLTYEGLIDEIFGIQKSAAKFPAEQFLSNDDKNTESLAEEKKLINLNSGDKLYADIRDKNFNAVGAYLSKEAKKISSQLEGVQNKSVQEMKLYVQRLPQILAKKESLSNHCAIAECIKTVTDSFDFLESLQAEQEFLNCIEVDKASPYVEDLIAQKAPLIKVLRLICLQCLTGSGLKPKLLEYYKREIVQVYGIESLLALINLEKAGLLKVQSGSRHYAVLRKALHLTMADTSEIEPTDISYVHSLYAPLSVRIAEQLTKVGGWKKLQDVLGLLPGPTLDETPQVPVSTGVGANAGASSVVLIFFIGGCTFAEVSALRFLSQQEDSNVEFVIATTNLINGNTFLQNLIECNKTN